MNEYLLFAGDRYYPCGGYNDFRGAFPTLDEAIQGFMSHHDWAHVVKDGQIVWTY